MPAGVWQQASRAGEALAVLVALWTLAAWSELGDRDVILWSPKTLRDGKTVCRSLTHALLDKLGLEGDSARRRVDRWLAHLTEVGLIRNRDCRRVVLVSVVSVRAEPNAPDMSVRDSDMSVRHDTDADVRASDIHVRVPDTSVRDSDTSVRPSDLILPNSLQFPTQKAADAREVDPIEATVAWCQQPADRDAMPADVASARDSIALLATTDAAWCSALRVAMRDGLTPEQVRAVVLEHARQAAASKGAGTWQRDTAANASGRAQALGIPAPSQLWSRWSRAVEWRAQALGQAPERKQAGPSRAAASSYAGGNEAARDALRAELGVKS